MVWVGLKPILINLLLTIRILRCHTWHGRIQTSLKNHTVGVFSKKKFLVFIMFIHILLIASIRKMYFQLQSMEVRFFTMDFLRKMLPVCSFIQKNLTYLVKFSSKHGLNKWLDTYLFYPDPTIIESH